MTPMRWAGLALCLAVAACGKGEREKPPGMPEGFTPVNQAFGVRMAGLADVDGQQRAPVVEFRAGGDYAMYPIITDCDGSFQRGVGLVYAADGTVREHVTQQPVETLDGSPQFGPVLNRICTPFRSALAAIKDDETHRRTRSGLLEIKGERGSQSITFKKSAVASGSSLAFVGSYAVGLADLVLVHEQDMGTSCPGGQYYVILVTAEDAATSRAFGTCTDGDPVVNVADGILQMSLPGPDGPVRYTYANGEVEGSDTAAEASRAADEAQAAADAACTADADCVAADESQAALDSANAAAGDAPEGGDGGLEGRWSAACEAASGRVTTPAGSVVAFSAGEARAYCNCLWRRAPRDAATLARRNALRDEPASALLPQGHSACLQDLM